MKILQIHNKYQLQGGEDVVVEAEKRLLESNGHTIFQYIKDNKEIINYSLFKKANLLYSSVWSDASYKEIKEIIKKEKPHICHVHNYMPLITPSIFYACKKENTPVVQTLHNYRMLCSNAYLFRNGKICEECLLSGSLYHSVKYGCYRGSRIQTFAVARMIEKHKKLGTWEKTVDAYIALTQFSKNKFIKGGLPLNKIFVKPNFLFEDAGYSENYGDYFIFAGRLDETKGLNVLIKASKELPKNKFMVAGDGPLKKDVNNASNMTYLGQLKKNELFKHIKNSVALVFPSVWYETFGLSIIEAFSFGKPVIASNLGAMSEIIEDGITGLLFEPGNADDLSKKIKWAFEHKDEMHQMGLNARKVYEEKYTPEKNYEILIKIYREVIEKRKSNS